MGKVIAIIDAHFLPEKPFMSLIDVARVVKERLYRK